MPNQTRMIWIVGLALLAVAVTFRFPQVRQIVVGG